MADRQSNHRLTVVDDSPELLALFGDLLRFDGVNLTLFDGSAKLGDIEESAPDLLVIDLHLGPDGLTGLDMIRLIRAHRQLQHVPIIVCSAALDVIAMHRDELNRTRNLFVLPMPFQLEELEVCVAAALAPPVKAAVGG